MSALHVFQMRAGPEWFAALDRWRSQQPGLPTRAAAIRWIVAEAIGDVADTGDTGDTAFGHDPLCDVTPEEMRAFLN